MNTQQLESFLAVAEHLNFARAAEALNITQSAVSRQIHALEDELGTKLFHRTSRSVVLTPSGIMFHEDAKIFMRNLQIATAKIGRHSKENIQVLAIGCSNETDCGLLAEVLQDCRKRLPELHPFLQVIPHRSIISLLFQGDLDILFGFQENVPAHEGIIYRELLKVPVCCAVSPEHKYAGMEKISEQELASENIILCYSYPIPSKVLNRQRSIEKNYKLSNVYYCDSTDAQTVLVKAGYGFAILPQTTLDDKHICYIPLENEETVSYGVFYKQNTSNPLLKKFLSIL